MRRAIARGHTWWVRLFVVAVLANATLSIPRPWNLLLMAVPFLLSLVRPHAPTGAAVEVVETAPPVRGRWGALNSPGSAVPSHKTRAYGQAYAIDLLRPKDGPAEPTGWALRPRTPQSYPSFGEPVLAMAAGTVVHVHDAQRDHRARDTWPSLLFMLTIEGFVRELGGASRIFGNHTIVRHDDGTHALYAHLRRHSATVRVGERVRTGQLLARLGNSGNSSEPHLHVQLMDVRHPTAASGIPMCWPDLVVEPTGCHPDGTTGGAESTAQAGMPANGQVFEVHDRRAA